ncbi:MAG TPA: DUF4942 domain-containing protein [Burkholderiaceae bacterium]|nr:DUF4942 domain-containing protein [Burkholderiaceae bacterium]
MNRDPLDMIEIPADDCAFEVVDDVNPFFAPVATDLLDSLLGQYQAARRNIDALHGVVMGGEFGNVVHYFIEGNAGDDQLHRSLYVDKLFAIDGAVGALNSAFWSKALALTDVYALMPQERKNQWNAQMRSPMGVKKRNRSYGSTASEWELEPLPDFDEATVRTTIAGLLHARSQFLAERVDGIFRNLSGHHVTNAPEAFGKRMIVARVLSEYDTINHDRAGYLHDLRCVIAKFMGREEPAHFGTTDALIKSAKEQRGEWVYADGGALKLKVFKVGTAHLEVHPDMAYRLNQILAFMHPHAIPAEFRARPARKSKAWALLRRPLPFAVTSLIATMRPGAEKIPNDFRDGMRTVPNTRRFDFGDHDKAALAEAVRIIESIGGVKTGHYWTFDYEPADVLREIATTGCIPDHVSHQFFPTPETVAAAVIDAAEIGDGDTCLEPSAGHGALADLMPRDRTRCVEVSPLHCAILKAKGFDTIEADFIKYAEGSAERFDRVVGNPPFCDGRWQAHTLAAAGLVAPGGRLVFVLPASARNALTLPGFDCAWSRMYVDEFAGTGAAVVILTAIRKA